MSEERAIYTPGLEEPMPPSVEEMQNEIRRLRYRLKQIRVDYKSLIGELRGVLHRFDVPT